MTIVRQPEQTYDLLLKSLKGARLYDSKEERFDEAPDIAMANGTIVAMGQESRWDLARAVRWVQDGQIIVPKLHDIHVHLADSTYWGRGMDADKDCLSWGTGLAVDAGSTGWINFPDFRRNVIDDQRMRTEVRAFLNVAPAGRAVGDGEGLP